MRPPLLIEALPLSDRALWATAFYSGLRRGARLSMPTFSLSQMHAQLDRGIAEQCRRFDQEPAPSRLSAGATAGGDEWKLRGIPAVARGVGGAIPGTRP